MAKKAPRNPSYKTYNNKFKEVVEKQVPVTGIKFDTEVSEVIANIDDYKQCYDPHDYARSQLPSYWFISKEGFLISVKVKKPTWVKPNLDANRSQFTPSKNGKVLKPITTYDLTALVWGSYRDPDAIKLLNKYGLSILGKNKIDRNTGKHLPRVQAHHINPQGYLKDGSIESYIINNDPTQLQLLTNRVHNVLTYMTGDFERDIMRDTSSFSDVPHTTIKVYQDKIHNLKTGEITDQREVLTTEQMQRMQIISLEAIAPVVSYNGKQYTIIVIDDVLLNRDDMVYESFCSQAKAIVTNAVALNKIDKETVITLQHPTTGEKLKTKIKIIENK